MRLKSAGIFVVALCVLASCTHVSVESNIKEYSAPCSINVIDARPDKRMLSGSTVIHTIDITPPIETVLRSRLCSSPEILNYSNKQPIRIEITDLKFASSDEMFLVIAADIRTRGQYYLIQSIGKESFVGFPSTRIERLLNLSLDDFTKKLVLKLQ